MTHSPSLLAVWRLAEQQSKVLFAHWSDAMASNDVAAAGLLKTRLVAQRAAAHDAFLRLIDNASTVSRACRFRGWLGASGVQWRGSAAGGRDRRQRWRDW